MADDRYRFGIEEEYFLADADTRDTPERSILPFHEAVKARLPEAGRELLECQIEAASPPETDFSRARDTLADRRAILAEVAREHDLLVFAAGTHPRARWPGQRRSRGERYQGIHAKLGLIGRRSLFCGMHVHVEVADPDRRIDLMRRLLPFQPLLLALSASSPFWQGEPTGLAAYRLSAFGELPRTGLPEVVGSEAEYARFVRIMVAAGAVEDASFLWWSLRPSIKFPTLELRISDACTRLEDALAVAALFRCLVRLVERRPDVNAGVDGVSRGLAAENLWRAQAHGVQARLIDEASETARPFPDTLEGLLALIDEDADALGCRAEVEGARRILAQGTSADRQVALFDEAGGADASDALMPVVDWLAAATRGEG